MKAVRKLVKFVAVVAAVAAVAYCVALNWDRISEAVSALLEKLGIEQSGCEWDDYADWED